MTTGDSVQWVVVPDPDPDPTAAFMDFPGCNMTLRRRDEEEERGGELLVTFPTGE